MDITMDSNTTSPSFNMTSDPEVWKKSLPVQLSVGMVGILGNFISLLVFTRPTFSKLSTSVFLRALSVVDILLIIEFNTCTVYAYTINPNPSSLEEVRFHPVGQWVLISLATASAWTIVSVSIERVIAVCVPLKVKIICTKKNAMITCGCLVPLMFILNIPTIFVKPGAHDVLPLPIYFTVLYSVAPSTMLIVCNIILIYKIHKRHVGGKRQAENRGLTIMLIVNSLGFVGLTLPYSIFHLMGHKITDQIHIVRLLKILESLSAINHSVNFIFYGASGSLFRRELCKLFCRRCRKQESLQQTPRNTGSAESGESRPPRLMKMNPLPSSAFAQNDPSCSDSGIGSEVGMDSSRFENRDEVNSNDERD